LGDRERAALRLRAIRVSAQSALGKDYSERIRGRIRDRTDDLLADLAATVRRDGGDEEILAAIEAARQEIRR
jgi:hypothetical protein